MRSRLGSFLRRTAVLGAVAAVTALSAAAQNITYTFSGTGSGSIGSQSFANTAFSFSVTVATSSVNTSRFGAGIPQVSPVVMNFTLALPTPVSGTINDVYVFNNQSNGVIGFGTTARSDLMNLLNLPGMTTYALVTDYAPTTASSVFVGQFANQATSEGALSMSSATEVSFQASLESQSVVPEPSTYVLLSTGLLAIGGIARRRRVTA